MGTMQGSQGVPQAGAAATGAPQGAAAAMPIGLLQHAAPK